MKKIILMLLLLLALAVGAHGSIDKATFYVKTYDVEMSQPELPLDPVAWGEPANSSNRGVSIPLALVALFMLGCGLIIVDRR